MIDTVLGDRRTGWAVAALIIVLFATANLPWQLDDYDQAKQAFTSFEMIKEGHWFYQHTPHEHIATKPPLVGWISAAIFAVTRSWEVAWRLPSLFGRACLCGRIILLCKGSLWIERCINRTRRVWIESAQSATGNARADGYATRIGDLFDWRADLAKVRAGNTGRRAIRFTCFCCLRRRC